VLLLYGIYSTSQIYAETQDKNDQTTSEGDTHMPKNVIDNKKIISENDILTKMKLLTDKVLKKSDVESSKQTLRKNIQSTTDTQIMHKEKHIGRHHEGSVYVLKEHLSQGAGQNVEKHSTNSETGISRVNSFFEPHKLTREEVQVKTVHIQENITIANPSYVTCSAHNGHHINENCISLKSIKEGYDVSSTNNHPNSDQEKKTEKFNANALSPQTIQNRSGTSKDNNSDLVSDYVIGENSKDKLFLMKCVPTKVTLAQGKDKLINCNVENRGNTPISLKLECLGLSGVGIGCYVEGGEQASTLSLDVNTAKQFNIKIVAPPKISNGSYPFVISAD